MILREGRHRIGGMYTPREIARKARQALEAKADPVRARGAERYFKETVKCYGVASPDVRALEAELYALVKGEWTYAEAVGLCDLLFADPELEAKGVGGLMLARFKKSYPPAFFSKVKGWLAAAVQSHAAGLGGSKEVKDALKEYFQIMAQVHRMIGEYNAGLARLDKATGVMDKKDNE